MALGLILLLILFLPPNAMCAVESALVEITENATTTEWPCCISRGGSWLKERAKSCKP